jgi:hypothetical protein
MASDNLRYAPRRKFVDGLHAVPIDVQSIDAQLVFDASLATAAGDATRTYTVGPYDGCPILPFTENKAVKIPFDIRPTEQHVYA